MCEININDNDKQVFFKLSTKNLTLIEKHKVEEAFKQLRIKAAVPFDKFKKRVNKIIKQQSNENKP